MNLNVNFNEFYEDSDEELLQYENNVRPYVVRQRPDIFNMWCEQEFYKRFRLTKTQLKHFWMKLDYILNI